MNKKDIITVILDKKDGKQVIGGYIFRKKEYLKEDKETDKELCARISKEHPDFIKLLKEQKDNHKIVATSLQGIKKDDTIIIITDNQKENVEIVGYIFRNKQYLKEEKETNKELCARIKKEHPDFMQLLKKAENNKTLKTTTLKKLEKETKKEQKNKKSMTKKGKAIIATITAGVLFLTGYVGFKHAKKYWGKDKNNDITIEMINNMTLNELLSYLNEGKQKESFELINNAQNNFNNNIANKISLPEDSDAKLYLTSEEIISLFAVANADTYTTESFYEIFENSNLLNASEISNNYTQAARVLWAYYSRAIEKSGIAELFQAESNKKLVEEFEELVIKYNKADNEGKKQVKNEINEFFANLTDESKLDNATKTNPEAVSYILTIGTSWAHANRLINETTKDRLVGINEVVTCDNLYKQLEFNQQYALQTAPYVDSKTDVINNLPQAMNKQNQQSNNRDIEITFNGIQNTITNSNNKQNTTSNNQTQTNITKQEEITKQEAVETFGKEEVAEKEQVAEEEIKEENKQEEINIQDFQNGYNVGYEVSYIHCATTGEKISTETEGTNKYKEGYQAGVNAGYIDGLIEYEAYLKAIQQSSSLVRTR